MSWLSERVHAHTHPRTHTHVFPFSHSLHTGFALSYWVNHPIPSCSSFVSISHVGPHSGFLGSTLPGPGPLQYSCHSSILENSMDRGAWQATVHSVTHNTTEASKQQHGLALPYLWRTLSKQITQVQVQSLSHVRLFATPWTTACQASNY